MLLSMLEAAKATAENTKDPEIKLDMPTMNRVPVSMSLFKSFIKKILIIA